VTPTRRAVGHTRPQPPNSNGKAKGHAKSPNEKAAAAPPAAAGEEQGKAAK
jgi:hypothetical protein